MKNISNLKLHEEIFEVAKAEKAATFKLLEYLHEIDRRKIYLERGFGSLYAYVKDYLGYSEHQAFERVSAMRLAFKVEAVKTALQAGRITLTTTATLASHARKTNLEKSQVAALLPALEQKSTREVEKILRPDEKTKSQILKMDEEMEALLKRYQELDGHPGMEMEVLLKQALKNAIAAKTTKHEPKRQGWGQKVPGAPQVHTRTIPIWARALTLRRSNGRCEFIDRQTGRRCEARHGLQFDHQIPRTLNGGSEEENIRHLCGPHNRAEARAWGVG